MDKEKKYISLIENQFLSPFNTLVDKESQAERFETELSAEQKINHLFPNIIPLIKEIEEFPIRWDAVISPREGYPDEIRLIFIGAEVHIIKPENAYHLAAKLKELAEQLME